MPFKHLSCLLERETDRETEIVLPLVHTAKDGKDPSTWTIFVAFQAHYQGAASEAEKLGTHASLPVW